MQTDVVTHGSVESAQREFASDVIFLNTATLGLPPRRTVTAMQAAVAEWAAGRAVSVAYDIPVAAARRSYAALVGVDPDLVAVGGNVSVFAGLIAASLPADAEVLTASGDFTSIVFPFHVQARRGVTVREVALEGLVDAITERTTLVAVSAVQSADGRVADLEGLQRACAATGTRILLDVTQASGWLPIDASRYAYTVCSGYKWLLAARGSAFLTVQRPMLESITPHTSGWYAGEDRWNNIYGGPLRLAADARRFDLSPGWLAWIGAATSLELLREVGVPALHAHAVGLANRFRAGIGLSASNTAIVTVIADADVPELMRAAGIIGATRNGRLRLSFHISTRTTDVDTALEVLSGHLQG